MGGLYTTIFGKTEPEKPKLSKEDNAIFECKKTRDNIKAFIKRLEKNSTNQKNKAKEYLKQKNRDKAKIHLNQSKFYAAQVESSSNQLSAIEEQILLIEQTKSQKDTFKVLEEGNKVLKSLQKEVNIEKWEKISGDMEEMKNHQDEIGDFFKSRGIDLKEYDEDLDREVEKLMKIEENAFDKDLIPEAISKSVMIPSKNKENVKKDKVLLDA